MPSKKELGLMTKALGLEGVVVTHFGFISDFGIVMSIENEQKEKECPKCQAKTSKIHQNNKLIIRDLTIAGKSSYLKINRRHMRCEKCGNKFVEDLDYVKKKRKFTERMVNKIVKEVLNSDIKNTAKNNEVSEQEIETMLKDLGKELKKEKPVGLKKLGVDEIYMGNGESKYCAVLVDIEKKKMIGLVESRKKEELTKYLKEWGEEVLEEVQEVSMDMWKGYKNVAEELMPNAEKVVDRFHVMKKVNEELDKGRKKAKKEVEAEKKKARGTTKKKIIEKKIEAITSGKYILLKNQEDLDEEGRLKLELIREHFPLLGTMHRQKECFRKIYETSENWADGLLRMANWMRRAQVYFPISCGMIKRWLGEIVAYFDNRTTQGTVEGINNKLKLIKRRAYGFRNFDNFQLRCHLTWEFNC